MRLTEFDKFCLAHICADDLKDHRKYCPMADKIRKRTGNYPSPPVCERFYKEMQEGERK